MILRFLMVNANRGATGFKSNEFDEEYDRPSKSQKKRDMIVLQKLGEQLAVEPKDRIMRVPMPDDLRAAILECQRTKGHEARRRQMQFIGKKMRDLNEEQITTIQKMFESWRGQSKSETALMHALERQRERLLADDKVLTDLLEQHRELDAQHLRTLVRNARKEYAENKPPKAYREIFQILKQLQSQSEAQGDDDDATEEDES